MNAALAHIACRRWQLALQRSTAAVAVSDEQEATRLTGIALGVHGLALALGERDEEALEALRRSERISALFPGDAPGLREGLALLALRSGQRALARTHLQTEADLCADSADRHRDEVLELLAMLDGGPPRGVSPLAPVFAEILAGR